MADEYVVYTSQMADGQWPPSSPALSKASRESSGSQGQKSVASSGKPDTPDSPDFFCKGSRSMIARNAGLEDVTSKIDEMLTNKPEPPPTLESGSSDEKSMALLEGKADPDSPSSIPESLKKYGKSTDQGESHEADKKQSSEPGPAPALPSRNPVHKRSQFVESNDCAKHMKPAPLKVIKRSDRRASFVDRATMVPGDKDVAQIHPAIFGGMDPEDSRERYLEQEAKRKAYYAAQVKRQEARRQREKEAAEQAEKLRKQRESVNRSRKESFKVGLKRVGSAIKCILD